MLRDTGCNWETLLGSGQTYSFKCITITVTSFYIGFIEKVSKCELRHDVIYLDTHVKATPENEVCF